MMQLLWLRRAVVAMLVMLALPVQAVEHPAIKYRIKLPPSADLVYAVQFSQHGLTLNGESVLRWRVSGNRYGLNNEMRSSLLGKAMESKSEGMIDAFGLAPLQLTEKRMRKPASSATFDREHRLIRLTDAPQTYPLHGGEQDRASIMLQLVSVARGAPQKFVSGSEWKFFVVGRKSAETWTFRVIRKEKISTPMGEVQAVRITRLLPEGSREQQLELWLAPSLDWFPVRVSFHDADGTQSDQKLLRIEKK
ncbi:MAG: hypothetical protein H6R01_1276 [Burkholderiaceae bacterium]|nr:hypothetical protein [Burkholderiaceae bacterium]